MNTLKVVGISIIFSAFLVLIRAFKGEVALPISLCGSVFLLGCALSVISPIIGFIKELGSEYFGNYLTVLIKSLGIAMVTGTASELCRDFGEISLAQKIDFFGKCSILSLSIPIIQNIISVIREVVEI